MTGRTPVTEQLLTDDDAGAIPWSVVQERLENPEKARTYWLATLRPDGRPHVMPVIGAWIDGAFYFISGDDTRKGRNLAGDSRCVIAVSSTVLPSLDIIVEGDAVPVTDQATLHRVTDAYRSKLEWPLEVKGDRVEGPNAPTAGPPPYTVFRLTPATVFGLPGTTGMEQFDPAELPRPTRCDSRPLTDRVPSGEVLLVADQVAPFGLGSFVGRLPHCEVGHEVVRRGAVPVPLPRWRVNGVAGVDLDGLGAAGLDPPDTLGHVERLSHCVGVPGISSSRCEADDADADARGRFAEGHDVEPDVADEAVGRSLGGRRLRLDLHAVDLLS